MSISLNTQNNYIKSNSIPVAAKSGKKPVFGRTIVKIDKSNDGKFSVSEAGKTW